MSVGTRHASVKPTRKVREIRLEGHLLADDLGLKKKPGYLSVEVMVRKSKDVKMDPEKLDAILNRKWEETFKEISSLIEEQIR